MTITLNGSDLTVTEVVAVARHGAAVALAPEAVQTMAQSRAVVEEVLANGGAAPADVVRGAMVCLANSYAQGVTGVRPELAQMIVTLLNEGFAPPVRRLGSGGHGGPGPMARP